MILRAKKYRTKGTRGLEYERRGKRSNAKIKDPNGQRTNTVRNFSDLSKT